MCSRRLQTLAAEPACRDNWCGEPTVKPVKDDHAGESNPEHGVVNRKSGIVEAIHLLRQRPVRRELLPGARALWIALRMTHAQTAQPVRRATQPAAGMRSACGGKRLHRMSGAPSQPVSPAPEGVNEAEAAKKRSMLESEPRVTTPRPLQRDRGYSKSVLTRDRCRRNGFLSDCFLRTAVVTLAGGP